MLYVLVIIGAIGAFVYAGLPKLSRAHAAQAKPLGPFVRAHKRYPFAAFIRDTAGNRIDLSNRMIGSVSGKSCAAFGLSDGSEFIADYLNSESAKLWTTEATKKCKRTFS